MSLAHMAYVDSFMSRREMGIYLKKLEQEMFWAPKGAAFQSLISDRKLSLAGKKKLSVHVSRN
ncbi:MAG: hypothetical protein K9M11_03120 [Candidatus Pacebacteria bacterium]|nr:hypothetical protein [Candidatus Paceibacterota bacterium]